MVAQYLKLLTAFLLLLRFIYWIHASYQSENTLPSDSLRFYKKIVSLCFAYGVDAFIFIQLIGLNLLPIQSQNTIIPFLGLILVIIGVGISILARRQLAENWTYGSHFHVKQGHKLITHGIFHFVRHPIYLGAFLSYIGAEMVCNSFLFISFYAFFFVFYLQAKREEALLLSAYGGKYKTYMDRTAMFIPYIF